MLRGGVMMGPHGLDESLGYRDLRLARRSAHQCPILWISWASDRIVVYAHVVMCVGLEPGRA